jgi:hypothetical protein
MFQKVYIFWMYAVPLSTLYAQCYLYVHNVVKITIFIVLFPACQTMHVAYLHGAFTVYIL